MSDKTVLYVEDNEYNRKIVRQLFSRTRYRLIEAIDGEDGIAAAQREIGRASCRERVSQLCRSRWSPYH